MKNTEILNDYCSWMMAETILLCRELYRRGDSKWVEKNYPKVINDYLYLSDCYTKCLKRLVKIISDVVGDGYAIKLSRRMYDFKFSLCSADLIRVDKFPLILKNLIPSDKISLDVRSYNNGFDRSRYSRAWYDPRNLCKVGEHQKWQGDTINIDLVFIANIFKPFSIYSLNKIKDPQLRKDLASISVINVGSRSIPPISTLEFILHLEEMCKSIIYFIDKLNFEYTKSINSIKKYTEPLKEYIPIAALGPKAIHYLIYSQFDRVEEFVPSGVGIEALKNLFEEVNNVSADNTGNN